MVDLQIIIAFTYIVLIGVQLILTDIILTLILEGKYNSHFTEGKSEAGVGEVTCLRS